MKKQQRNQYLMIAVTMVLVIGIVVSMDVLPDEISLSNVDGTEFTIPLPKELAFSGGSASNENASISCNVKQTTFAIDSAGNTLETKQSEFLTGNPLLTLTDSQNRDMAGYVVDMKMFCKNNFSNTSDDFTLEVDPSTATLAIISQDSDKRTKTTVIKNLNTKAVTFASGDGEKSLGFFSVYASEIEDDLDKTTAEFTTIQNFRITANLDVNWKAYPNNEYQIPVKYGDIESWHTAKIVNDVSVLDPELADPDGDGIINKHDQCDDDRETFNGYKDGDGCPDTNPDDSGSGGSSSSEPTSCPSGEELDTSTDPNQCIVTQSSCNADGKTWYKSSSGVDYCGTGFKSGQVTCSSYLLSTKQCFDKDGVEIGFVDTSNSEQSTLKGRMLWNVVVRDDNGGTFAFTPDDDPSPFTFAIPLDITGGKNIGDKKQISLITAEGLLKFDNTQQHNLITTKSSDVTYTVWIGLGDKSSPQWIQVKQVSAQDFIPRNGASETAGMPIGNIEIRASEIEGKISASDVPLGTSKDLQIKVIAEGNVGIEFNHGGVIKPLKVALVGIGATGDRDSDNNNFRWTNLVIARGIDGTTGATSSNTGSGTGLDCEIGTQNKITNKETGESFCINIGTTGNDPNPDPVIGEDGVEICVDDTSGVGGFPCTPDYRNLYCNGTTQCGTPDEGNDISGGNILDPDKFVLDNDGSDTVITPNTSGDDVACTTKGVNTLSLSNNACVIVTGGSDDQESESISNICIGGNCDNGTSDNSLMLVGIVIAVIGVSAIAIKKARK